MGLLSSRRIGGTGTATDALPVFRVSAATKAALAASIADADAAADDEGRIIYLPAGEIEMTRDGSNSWCLDVARTNSDRPIVIQGVPGQTILKHPVGMPATSVSFLRFDRQSNITIRDITFDGNWGNHVTEIAAGSDMVALPAATINVESTGDMPSSGTLRIQLSDNSMQDIAYTGKTATSFTGCSGGVGRMYRHNTVGYVDTNTNGINHTTQDINPSNHGVMARGCTNVLIENCTFRQMYGDGVWLGTPADDDLQAPTMDVRIVNCDFYICARNGVSFGAATEDVVIDRCRFKYIHNTAIDSEPNYLYGGSRNITIQNCKIERWWASDLPAYMISVVGGDTTEWNISGAARNWNIVNCDIRGMVHIDCAWDVKINKCRIRNDVTDNSYSAGAIYAIGPNDGISIIDNWLYSTAAKSAGSSGPNNGVIHVSFAGNGSRNAQPAGVQIKENRIFARAALNGIWVNSHGGNTRGLAAVTSPVTGTATSVTDTTLVHTGAGWSGNQFEGKTVELGGFHALILSNTTDTLTLQPGHPSAQPYAWRHPETGRLAVAPGVGTYVIRGQTGFLDISDNHIDCGYDGNAAGAHGVYLFNDRAGGRISITNNKIKNVSDGAGNTGWGVHVVGDSSVPVLFLEIRGNRLWDDQAVVTSGATVRFASEASLTSIVKLIIADNGTVSGVSTALSGVAAGKWLTSDGDPQAWVGFGVPVHSAPQGSTYINKSGTGADSFYVNTDGGTTWGAR